MAAYMRNDLMLCPPRGKSADRGKPTDYCACKINTSASTTNASASFVLKHLKEKVATSSDATTYASELIRLHQVKPVPSYSWIDGSAPTIVVQDSPFIWADDRPPVMQVPLNTGVQAVQHIHHHASKMGNLSPMWHPFASIDALNDDFPYKDLYLVTDRNGLRKLLCHVDNVPRTDEFRIDVDLVRKTCQLTRREEKASVEGHNVGYGHEYLRAATKEPPSCEKMLNHKRIVTYKSGSLSILLGFTVDACVGSKKVDNDLLASFSSLSIGAEVNNTVKPEATKLTGPSPGGLCNKHTSLCPVVPQSDLTKMKPRSSYRESNWRKIYLQLYLSQTPWLYMARQPTDVFQSAQKVSLSGKEMKLYAEMMEQSLGKLKNLLKEIPKAVCQQGEGVPLSLMRQGATLSLWKRRENNGKPLGEYIRNKFKK